MNNARRTAGVLMGCAMLLGASGASAQDWPQWRGLHRDARVTGFNAPTTWPKELTKKWTVTVGDGVATPALVGDRLYVFSRQGSEEVTRCLDAATGKELWIDKYAAAAVKGAASRFPGPRGSPAVADSKVVTLGVSGTLSCLEAATGKTVWRKDDFKNYPKFFASCSPIVVDGLCIAQLGGESRGGIAAYDLASGNEKWKWTGDGTAYASPVVLTVDGAKVLVAETARKVVGIAVADGKLLWETSFAVTGRGYNAATPVVEGQTVIYAGSSRGTRAVKLDKEGSGLAGKQLWSNAANSVQYNTPVVRNGLVFGISDRDSLFCLNAKTGATAWTAAISGNRGYGSIVDAGSVLLALTPSGELIVFEPTDKEFKQLAKYRVADGGTYAYPILAGNRLYVKDRTAVTLWTFE